MTLRARVVGLLATLLLLAVLVALPVTLLALGADPIPHSLPTLDQLRAALTTPDDGTLALTAIKVIAWAAWAFLAVSILLDVGARLRRVRPPRLPGLALPQLAAHQLVGAAALLFVVAPTGIPPGPGGPDTAHLNPVVATAPRAPTATASQTPGSGPAPTAGDAHHDRGSPGRYTVKEGDSLSSIAQEHLGDADRWPEILTLNPALQAHPDLIYAGTALTMPTPSPRTGTRAGHTYTVRAGDTLSAIAHRELGDPDAYPAIFQASRHIRQPGGVHLVDPDVIDVGQTLVIPGPARPTPTPPQTGPGPTPTRPATTVPPPPAVNRPPRDTPEAATPVLTAPVPAPASVTQRAADGEDGEHPYAPWMLAGLTGAGAVLAGSMLTLLRRRRRAQSRSRRPGRTLAAPDPGLIPVEKTLTAVGGTTAATVDHLDRLLRRVAARAAQDGIPMPDLAAVELTTTAVVIHLRHPSRLPQPWTGTPDEMHWSIDPGADLDQVGPDLPDQPAPWPLLVTIGVSDQDHVWLLNVEEHTVTITGDPTFGQDLARYLAAEIACNPWSGGVDLDCVGVAHEVAPMNPDRIRTHHIDTDPVADLLTDAVHTIDRTRDLGLDVTTARSTQAGADAWPARMLLIDAATTHPALPQLLDLIDEHHGRTATAVVVSGNRPDTPGLTLHVTDDGRVTMPHTGLDLVAAGLTSDEAQGCAALLAQAETTQDAPIPVDENATDGWRAWADQAGALRREHTLPRDTDPAGLDDDTSTVLDGDDDTYIQAAATTEEDLDALAPLVASTVRHHVEDADPTLDRDVAAWFSDSCPLPRLTLLGPVAARTRGVPVTKRKAYWTEILAYLATHPHGATPDELADAFTITPSKAREYARTVREWLGTNPTTGERHLPDARETPAALSRGGAVYQVVDLLVDADLFRRLRVRSETRGADGFDDLRTALRLVNGRPFDQLRPGGWAWLHEGDRLDQHLTCAIVDVAHLLTTHALHSGDLPLARLAAETATRAAPHEEIPRLDLAAVANAEGHHGEARRILRDEVCNRTDDDEAPPELEPRTQKVIQSRRDMLGTRAS